MREYRRSRCLISLFLVISVFLAFSPAIVAEGGQVAVSRFGQEEAQEETEKQQDEDWSKDIDKKLDTTIKILQVVKEEVKDLEPPPTALKTSAGRAASSEQDWAGNLKAWIQRAARIWRKIRKATAPAGGGKPLGPSQEEQEKLTKDLSDKLNKTIQAMQVIKEELDKISEEQQ